GAEEQAAKVGGDAEVHQADFLDRVDDDDVAAPATDVRQRAHEPRVVGSRVAADQEVQVGVFNILQADGRGAGPERAGQPDGAGLVAVVGAVVYVVGAVQAGEQLQQEAGLVGGPAAAIEEVLVGCGVLELVGDPLQGLIPVDHPV